MGGGSLGIGKLEGVNSKVGQRAVTHRWRLRRLYEGFRGRVGPQEFFQLRGFWSVGAACGDSEQEVPELFGISHRKAVEGQDDKIRLRSVRQRKFHSQPRGISFVSGTVGSPEPAE